jgi:hypothetical protein
MLDPAAVLAMQPEPLFAVLDAARSPRILELLRASRLPHFSLYKGDSAVKLKEVSPYLVFLPPGHPLLQQLVAEGWGQSWGIFLTCNGIIDDVWRQLRRSLMVRIEGTNRLLYFRFYDPRVARSFLPMATEIQWTEMMGPISTMMVEAETPDALLQYSQRSRADRFPARIAVQPAHRGELAQERRPG